MSDPTELVVVKPAPRVAKTVNKAWLGSWVLILGCLSGPAQTNWTCAGLLYEPPAIALRPLTATRPSPAVPATNREGLQKLKLETEPAPELSLLPPTNSTPRLEQATISHGQDFGDFYGPLQPGHFYLVQPERPAHNVIVRAVEGIFDPELIRLGKTTTLSCTVVTAIKRKNPLCLLNPLFFQLSW